MLLVSIALILIVGMLSNKLFSLLGIPGLVGMIISGFILGPSVLNLITGDILGISEQLMEMALVLVLTNAGLSMDINDLKEIGKPAILMCFVPAVFEIIGAMIIGPSLLGLTLIESALLGCILAPVAAAVCVPYMLIMIKQGYGTKKKIPQIIIAGTSIDDVLVMVLFVSFLQLAKGGSLSVMEFAKIPLSVIIGAIVGLIFGKGFLKLTSYFRMKEISKFITFLSFSFFLAGIEKIVPTFPFSGMLALILMGMLVYNENQDLANKMNQNLNKIWVFAELFLFTLVGASIDLSVIDSRILLGALGVLAFCTVFRYIGILISLHSTNMNAKEKLFCGIGYLPKTTVQAALGAVPLAHGIAGGEIILTVSVISILIFGPLGAILIERSYKVLLDKEDFKNESFLKSK